MIYDLLAVCREGNLVMDDLASFVALAVARAAVS